MRLHGLSSVPHRTIPLRNVETGYTAFDGDSFFNAIDEGRVISTRLALRQVLDRHAWGRDVWITETGLRASPVSDARELERQATYVRRVLEEQPLRDWWTASFFYELVDCGVDQPGCDIDGFGLTRPHHMAPRTASDFDRKPAYEQLRSMLASRPALSDDRVPACANGRDDDGDSRTDGEDRGCRGTADDDERDEPRARIAVPRLSSGPRTDGFLSEWTRAERTIAPRWSGEGERDELRAELMLGWHDDVLYVAVEVTDDVHAPSDDLDALWSGDSLQLAFDPNRAFGDAYDDDHELDFAGARGGPIFHRNHGRTNDDAIRTGILAIERTTSYELAIPFEAIGLEAAGDVTGFTFVVNDRDATERRGWLALTRGLADEKEPYWFAELELLEADAPRDAGVREDGGVVEDVDAGEEPPEEGGGGGCGCSTSGPTSAIPWLAVALAISRRRRSL